MKSTRAASFLALAWFVLAFAITIPIYLRYQNLFRLTGSYFLLVRALPILCATAAAYAIWLRPFVRRYELALLFLLPITVCLVAQPVAVLAVVSVAIAALVLGDCLTPLMQFEEKDAPIVWTCGFGLLILMGAGLGKAGILSAPVILALFSLCFVRAVFVQRRLRGWLAGPFATWKTGIELTSPAAGICIFFLFFFTGCSLLLALTPITAFDVVLYHFPLARHYAQTHSIQPTPWITESYFPQGAEVLMTIGFALAGEPAARLLMPLLGLLFLWLLARVGRCCGLSRSAAFTGVAIAATFPFLQWTLTVAKNDSAFSLFQLGALYSFLQWQRNRGQRWLILLAFLLGQTAGIKHVALLGLVAIAPLCLFAWKQQKFSWRLAMAACVVFAASGLFWHVQTWILSGDALYPRSAGQALHTPSQEHGGRIVHAAVRYATLPWYLLFHGEKAFESSSPNPLGIFCFVFLPVAIAGIRKRKWNSARVACACFALLYLIYWSSIGSTLRYAIVPFGLVALFIGAFLLRESASPNRVERGATVVLCSYCFLFSLLAVMSIEVNTLQIAMLLKRMTPEEYLGQVTPAVKPLFRLAKKYPGASVFAIDSCARYYAPNPMRFMCTNCTEGCDTNNLLLPIGSKLVEFVILPASGSFAKLREILVASYGGAMVDHDDEFQIFRLGPGHEPPVQAR